MGLRFKSRCPALSSVLQSLKHERNVGPSWEPATVTREGENAPNGESSLWPHGAEAGCTAKKAEPTDCGIPGCLSVEGVGLLWSP